MTTGADLLQGVRGRRLCFELAQRGADGDAVSVPMFDAARRVHEARGDIARGSVAYFSIGASDDAPPGPPRPTVTLVEALTTAAAERAVDAGHLLPALADAVAWAMYWQPPHAEDLVLADPAVSATLLPIAEAVVAMPETRWWAAPLDRDVQVRTVFEQTPPEPAPGERASASRLLSTARERLDRWRSGVLEEELRCARDRARYPDRTIGGTWWVPPALAGLDVTTRTLADAGSAALWLTEDEAGWKAAELVPCGVDPAARVLEITGPEDWAALVATYPLDVTASRQPDWFGAVDPREGAWLIPDWRAVAEVYDGVHVSVLGWLTTAGVAVPVAPSVTTTATTTLAGWDPDATWWLADALSEQGPGRGWTREGEAWRPVGRVRED